MAFKVPVIFRFNIVTVSGRPIVIFGQLLTISISPLTPVNPIDPVHPLIEFAVFELIYLNTSEPVVKVSANNEIPPVKAAITIFVPDLFADNCSGLLFVTSSTKESTVVIDVI